MAEQARIPETEVDVAQRRLNEAQELVALTSAVVEQRAAEVQTITAQLSQDCSRQLPADLDNARESLEVAWQQKAHSIAARALRETELAGVKTKAAAAAKVELGWKFTVVF